MPHAGAREQADESLPLARRRGREPFAYAPVGRVDPQLPAGLRVDEPQLTDIGEFRSRGSRTSSASTVCRAASRISGDCQSSEPRKSESTTTRARWRTTLSASSSAAPSVPEPAADSSRRSCSVSRRPRRPCRGGSTEGASPKEIVPRRLPRLVAA